MHLKSEIELISKEKNSMNLKNISTQEAAGTDGVFFGCGHKNADGLQIKILQCAF
ncbi:MAG: hypothetical protein NTU49_02100 [Gammaproteobacteria bacterium]|nr:hypothetical protein [Gammaproteobacteria bacterium]